MGATVRLYAVSTTAYPDESTVVAAHTSGAAKYQRWLDIRDAWPEAPITIMRAHRIHGYVEPRGFRECMEYRQIPFAKIGMQVRSDEGDNGVIVGHNDSANLNVLFTGGRWDGQTLNCHPAWQISYLVDGEWRRSPQAEQKVA